MSDVSKRFEQLVKSTYKQFLDQGTILPIKTKEGIVVGDVLIKTEGHLKNIYKKNVMIYKEISLNAVAIKIANLLAWNKDKKLCEELYDLDISYSKHFIDSKIFLDNYHRAYNSENHIRADILWIRYTDSKERAMDLKSRAEDLAAF
jgi:hypothetical protein